VPVSPAAQPGGAVHRPLTSPFTGELVTSLGPVLAVGRARLQLSASLPLCGRSRQVCSGTISRTKSAVNWPGSTGVQLGRTTNLVSPAAT
jgi:hypothetical protein